MEIAFSHRRNKWYSLRSAATITFLLGAWSVTALRAAPADVDDADAKPEVDAPQKDEVKPTPSLDPSNAQPQNLPDEVSKPAEKPIDAAELRNWFNDLVHRDASVREEARVHLMSMGRRNLETFQKIVEENRPLAPSQASTLRQIVNNVYLSGETYDSSNGLGGWIGIRMQEVVVGSGEPERV